MKIRRLFETETPPLALLLLADPSEELVRDYLHKGQCYVAEDGAEIIGEYVLLPTSKENVELINVAVVEKYHGKGIGKQLVLDAVERAKMEGFQAIEVGTGNSSIGQLALYQKCGFRMIGIDHDFFVRNYDEEIFENGIQCRDMIRLAQTV